MQPELSTKLSTAPVDYVSRSQTLRFPAGETCELHCDAMLSHGPSDLMGEII